MMCVYFFVVVNQILTQSNDKGKGLPFLHPFESHSGVRFSIYKLISLSHVPVAVQRRTVSDTGVCVEKWLQKKKRLKVHTFRNIPLLAIQCFLLRFP